MKSSEWIVPGKVVLSTTCPWAIDPDKMPAHSGIWKKQAVMNPVLKEGIMASRSAKWLFILAIVAIGSLGHGRVSQVAGNLVLPQSAWAAGDPSEKLVQTSNRYDSVVSKALARYHMAAAKARKLYLEAKHKSERTYVQEATAASTRVTIKINRIRDSLTQGEGGVEKDATQLIKKSVSGYAKTIASAYAKREKALKTAVEIYAKSLGEAAGQFQKDLKKAEQTLHTQSN